MQAPLEAVAQRIAAALLLNELRLQLQAGSLLRLEQLLRSRQLIFITPERSPPARTVCDTLSVAVRNTLL